MTDQISDGGSARSALERIPEPEYYRGKLIVKIIGVRYVADIDFNNKSDSYIVLKFAGKTEQTGDLKSNETFIFGFDPATTQDREIQLELWDYDTLNNKDIIGNLSISIKEFLDENKLISRHFTGTNKMAGCDASTATTFGSESGRNFSPVTVNPQTQSRATSHQASRSEQGLAGTSQDIEHFSEILGKGIVKIQLLKVTNEAILDEDDISEPYVTMQLGSQQFKTKNVKDLISVSVNEQYKFDYDSTATTDRQVKLELWTYNEFGLNEKMGELKLPLLQFLNKRRKVVKHFVGVNDYIGQIVGDATVSMIYMKDGADIPDTERSSLKSQQMSKRQREIDMLIRGKSPMQLSTKKKYIGSSQLSSSSLYQKKQYKQNQQDEEYEVNDEDYYDKYQLDDLIPVTQSKSIEQIKLDLKRGNVEVTIHSLMNIQPIDASQKSDPFVKVVICGECQQTRRMAESDDGLEFNSMFQFDFDPDTYGIQFGSKDDWDQNPSGNGKDDDVNNLKIELWDYDVIGEDDLIGDINISFLPFLDNKQKLTFSFTGAGKYFSRTIGDIVVSVYYTQKNEQYDIDSIEDNQENQNNKDIEEGLEIEQQNSTDELLNFNRHVEKQLEKRQQKQQQDEDEKKRKLQKMNVKERELYEQQLKLEGSNYEEDDQNDVYQQQEQEQMQYDVKEIEEQSYGSQDWGPSSQNMDELINIAGGDINIDEPEYYIGKVIIEVDKLENKDKIKLLNLDKEDSDDLFYGTGWRSKYQLNDGYSDIWTQNVKDDFYYGNGYMSNYQQDENEINYNDKENQTEKLRQKLYERKLRHEKGGVILITSEKTKKLAYPGPPEVNTSGVDDDQFYGTGYDSNFIQDGYDGTFGGEIDDDEFYERGYMSYYKGGHGFDETSTQGSQMTLASLQTSSSTQLSGALFNKKMVDEYINNQFEDEPEYYIGTVYVTVEAIRNTIKMKNVIKDQINENVREIEEIVDKQQMNGQIDQQQQPNEQVQEQEQQLQQKADIEPNPFVRLLFAGKWAKSTFGFEFNPNETEDRDVTLELWDTDENGFDQRLGKIGIAILPYLEDRQDVTMQVVAHEEDPEPVGTLVSELDLTIVYEMDKQEKINKENRSQKRLKLIEEQTRGKNNDEKIKAKDKENDLNSKQYDNDQI
ncbi:MAG: hypothetical protein EZS28_015651 [Streblomastix strix]|uniref:C2 domain-containing protein n=1 Tax=Streblomastix strix TaxID=222440 RepID=A0A5J4W293_9EUKA|nr:MAG: hypothetical protein EZS28_015651 [Streblomastix strix]